MKVVCTVYVQPTYGKMRQIRIIPFYGEDLYDDGQDEEGTKRGRFGYGIVQ